MIKILADSSCDLVFAEGTREYERFQRVPLTIISETKEYVDDEALDVTNMMEELEAQGGKTSTACPGPGQWVDAMKSADEVFIVTITSKLSGSYNSAMLARNMVLEENPNAKITVINSLSAGGELSLIVYKLMELIDKGLAYEQIAIEIEKYRQRTGLLFMLGSLENLIRNGRVSRVAGVAAKLLGINVIGCASEEGEFQMLHKARKSAKAYTVILEEMMRRGYKGGRVILTQCLNTEGAAKLYEVIREVFHSAEVMIMPTSGLCSFYAEKGGLLIGFEMGTAG